MITLIAVTIVLGACLALFLLLVRYNTSDDECYGHVDQELDRREQIRREGGAKIVKFGDRHER